ncbi:hypothetical protein ACIBO9_24570 [Streptomyces prunicolor]|uniref:hypothetical protein n=1 Tax=Streptomyces prunicolor TaxID=67348 RepID=UPI0037CCF4E1
MTTMPSAGAEQQPSAQLPAHFDAWLLDCVPVPNCDVCEANWRQLTTRKQSGDIPQAARHATEIRDHASGVHASPTN